MVWIKRNLFFVIGAAIAVGLLAAAGVYGYKNWQRNKKAFADLNQEYSTLRRLNAQNPLPGNDEINNIETARHQEQTLQKWIRQSAKYFKPIPPVPDPTNGVVTDSRFAAARDHTLNELQTEAANASVTLPPQYGFSFEAERTKVKFAPSGLPALAQQLGEVKAICKIFFAARVNSLDDIRRVPVSPDDAGVSQSDYLSIQPVTNDLAVFTPYEVTFRCFSQNLATVLTKLASSPHGFIVKGINVQPAAAVAATSSPAGTPPGGARYVLPGEEENPAYSPPGYQYQTRRPSYAPRFTTRSRGGLQTVLNEQLLSITMEIEIVKLLPGK